MWKAYKSVIFWCWTWLILAHIADCLSSLQRWGLMEMNPFFRDANHKFLIWHAVLGKGVGTISLGILSYFLYRITVSFDKRLATLLACAGPLMVGWMIWNVALNNLFMLLNWVNP